MRVPAAIAFVYVTLFYLFFLPAAWSQPKGPPPAPAAAEEDVPLTPESLRAMIRDLQLQIDILADERSGGSFIGGSERYPAQSPNDKLDDGLRFHAWTTNSSPNHPRYMVLDSNKDQYDREIVVLRTSSWDWAKQRTDELNKKVTLHAGGYDSELQPADRRFLVDLLKKKEQLAIKERTQYMQSELAACARLLRLLDPSTAPPTPSR